MTKPERKEQVARRKPAPIGKTAYEVLGVSETAGEEEIRKVYLAQLRRCPPERDPEGFKTIRRASAAIEDKAKRRLLDLSIFKKDSGLTLDAEREPDYTRLFLNEIFKLMLSSSDFYIRAIDNARFNNIEDKIRKLQ
jgi:curved DNA-binding protein CbpA